MAVEAMLINAVSLDNTSPISDLLHMQSNKYPADNHSSWLNRARTDTDRRLRRYNSNLTATTSSSNYHTSTFPSLFATLQTDTNKHKQTDKIKNSTSKAPLSRAVTSAKIWRTTRNKKTSDDVPSTGDAKTIKPQSVHPYNQPKYRFIWSSINGIKEDTNVDKKSEAPENRAKPSTNPERLSHDFNDKKTYTTNVNNNKKLQVTFKDNKTVLNRTSPLHQSAILKQNERSSKSPIKPADTKLSFQRSSLATSRSERMRYLSLVQFNVMTQNRNLQRYSAVNSYLSGVPNNRKLLLLQSKRTLAQDNKSKNTILQRPWTVAKQGLGKRFSTAISDLHIQRKGKILSTNHAKPSNESHRPTSQAGGKPTSTRPKTAHVRFSEVITEQKSVDLSHSTAKKTSVHQTTEKSKPNWISELPDENPKVKNEVASSTSKSDQNDVYATDETTNKTSENLHASSKESNPSNDSTPKLSLDQLRLRDQQEQSRTVDFLSTDQLLMRESIEKVQKWLRTLPKHFDSIYHISTPAQQDY